MHRHFTLGEKELCLDKGGKPVAAEISEETAGVVPIAWRFIRMHFRGEEEVSQHFTPREGVHITKAKYSDPPTKPPRHSNYAAHEDQINQSQILVMPYEFVYDTSGEKRISALEEEEEHGRVSYHLLRVAFMRLFHDFLKQHGMVFKVGIVALKELSEGDKEGIKLAWHFTGSKESPEATVVKYLKV